MSGTDMVNLIGFLSFIILVAIATAWFAKSSLSASDKKRIEGLQNKYGSKYRFVTPFWGLQIRVQAQEYPLTLEQDALEIAQYFWLDKNHLREDVGIQSVIGFFDQNKKIQFYTNYGYQDNRIILTLFKLTKEGAFGQTRMEVLRRYAPK